jgi:hypothetical protein
MSIVLNILHRHSILPPFALGEELGYGRDGSVFQLLDFPDRVAKSSALYDEDYSGATRALYAAKAAVLDFVKHFKPLPYVAVFERGLLLESQRDTVLGRQEFLVHYCVMPKLTQPTDNESKVFDTLSSYDVFNFKRGFVPHRIDQVLHRLHSTLIFDPVKVMTFLYHLAASPLMHEDIHERNIMKDDNGNYNLVDLDHCYLKTEKPICNPLSI